MEQNSVYESYLMYLFAEFFNTDKKLEHNNVNGPYLMNLLYGTFYTT